LIKKTVAEMHEYDESKMITALDGCSAPIFSIPVYNQALAYKNLVNFNQYGDLRKRACRLVIEAVKKYPMMVAGTQRYCTDMMNICGSRIIGKTGAEGIYCLSFIEEGAAACIKIDDGKMLPQYNIAQKIIEQTNIFDTETLKPLEHYIESELKNFNQYVTGKIKVSDSVLTEKIDLVKFT
jgi:L-asparaginase II